MEFPNITKHITKEKMIRISGAGNIHSNEKLAKDQGLGGIIAQGGQLAGYLSEMMIFAFGDGFLEGGEIAVKFIYPVRPGETVTTNGRVSEESESGERGRVDCEIWLENQDGRKVAVGTASAWAKR